MYDDSKAKFYQCFGINLFDCVREIFILLSAHAKYVNHVASLNIIQIDSTL